jgi:hypothetical protein
MTDFGKDQKKQVEINLGKGVDISCEITYIGKCAVERDASHPKRENLDNTIV